jgi:hypothetical protein
MPNYYIIMADVVHSGEHNGSQLMDSFKEIVNSVNSAYESEILSPLTITWGDEFQGVISSLEVGISIIIHLEEEMIHQGADYKLRYVLLYGEIETSINTTVAYEMLGSGLTDARKKIERLKSQNNERILISIPSDLRIPLNKSLLIYTRLIDGWKYSDFPLISAFIKAIGYKAVAENLGKDRSLMWRRSKSLRMDDYFDIKYVIDYLKTSK